MAIASLVLAIAWLGGVGAALAVVFALSARRAIARTHGALRGDGLAVGGLAVGIVGLVGAVVFWSLVAVEADHVRRAAQTAKKVTTTVSSVVNALTPHTYSVPLGRPDAIRTSDDNGITSMTVSSFSAPVSAFPPALFGYEYATVHVTACAGPSGSQSGPDKLGFALLFGSTPVLPTIVTAVSPNLLTEGGIADSSCGQGAITFAIASGTRPTAVRYEPDPFHTYLWTVPAS